MKNTKVFFYGAQIAYGVLISAAVLVVVLFFGRVATGRSLPAGAEEALSSLNANDRSGVEELIGKRDEERDRAEESRRVEEENSRRMQEAEEGFNQSGWHSSEQKEIGNNDPKVWSKFRNYAVLGDSRAVGFSYYHFLEDRRVLASGGNSIRNIPDRFEALEALQPDYVIFCYGLNDAGLGFWKDGETYAKEYMDVIEQLREILPNAKFIVSSTLPVTDEALSYSPSWKRIELYNAALAVYCPQHNVTFVNNDGIAAQYIDTLWQQDGIHLQPEFYNYWANKLYEGVRAAKYGAYTDGEPLTTAPAEDG